VKWRSRFLTVGAVFACVVYDPDATAADAKRVALLSVAVLCVASALFIDKIDRSQLQLSPSLRWGVAFFVLSAISLAWGRSPGWLDLGTWSGALGVGWAAAQSGEREARTTVRWVSVLVGAIVSSWALAAFAMGHRGFGIHAGQGNPNWLGLLLAIALPLSLDASADDSRQVRLLSGFSVMVQVVALFLSHSRVGWIAAGVSVAMAVVAAVRFRQRSMLVNFGALAVGLALSGAIGMSARGSALARNGSSVVNRLVDPADKPNDAPPARAIEGRVWIWRSSLDAVRQSLPLGAGLGGFGHAYLDAQGQRLTAMTPRSAARHFVNATTAHHDFVQVAVESGPLASLALLGCLALAGLSFLRARWQAGAGALVALLVCMMGDSPLRQPAPCVLVALVLAALPRGAARLRWSRYMPIGVLAVLGALLMVAMRTWLATRVLTAAERAEPTKRGLLFLRAIAIAPKAGEAQLAHGLHALASGQLSEASTALTTADPLLANVGTRTALGEVRLAEGSSGASDAFLSAIAWHPGSLRARMGLAESYRRGRKLEAAEEQAHIAVSLAPGEPRAIELYESILAERIDSLP
jgi:hypothetical protein